jgi:hypothetical protein
MELQLTNPKYDTDLEQAVALAEPPGEAAEDRRADSRNVVVTYGIHKGRYPIGGMTVADARRVLERLIRIDPTAVPVINGRPVDPTQRIGEHVTMLAFVKPSALKG